MRHQLRLATLGPVLALALVLVAPSSPGSGGGTPPSAVGAAGTGQVFGDAADFGSMAGKPLAQPVVGMAASRTGKGYWLVARDGGIFSFGDARFHGSTGAMRLNQPIVGMAATPSGGGYWFVAADGGVFSFGDARFQGSTGAMRLAAPIVDMAATPTGRGYWLVARDGGIFTFGDAVFAGSAAGTAGQAITGMTASPSGRGYWLVAADGRLFPFGDARSLPAIGPAAAPTVGVTATPDGDGVWAAASTGGVLAYGAAPRYGAADAPSPVVGLARTASGRGYWLVTSTGHVLTRVGDGPVGAYGFLAKDRAGQPLRYNPCQAIRYVINPDGAPAGAVQEVRDAFGILSGAMGITFRDAGTTTETHVRIGSGTRPSYQPTRYGAGQWAPILVSWTTEREEPVLRGNVLGYGGSTSYWTSSSDQAYVTGEVVFDRDLSIVRPGFGAGLTRGNLVLHELGHVLGLNHVDDRSQVMYASITSQSPNGLAAGDRAGLAQLGSQKGCLQAASPA